MACGLCEQHLVHLLNCLARFPDRRPVSQHSAARMPLRCAGLLCKTRSQKRTSVLKKGAKIADGCVTCPWHNSRFALDNGRVIDGPATFPLPHFKTRIRNGQIEVRMTPQ